MGRDKQRRKYGEADLEEALFAGSTTGESYTALNGNTEFLVAEPFEDTIMPLCNLTKQLSENGLFSLPQLDHHYNNYYHSTIKWVQLGSPFV